MANIKSQKKRIILDEKNRQRNVSVRSALKTYTKKFEQALASKENVDAALKKAISEIDRAARKGIIHPKNAARKKSRLQRRAHAGQ